MQGREASGGALRRSFVGASELSPQDLIVELRRVTEPVEAPFSLLSRLSPGGIVVRVLKAPRTERPFFGRVGDEGAFRIALVPRGEALTPYQPILSGRVVGEGEGSRLEVELAPHPQARTHSGLFGVAAVLLGGASLLRVLASPLVASIGILFAVAFAVFPGWRARQGFGGAADESLELLLANVPLTRV